MLNRWASGFATFFFAISLLDAQCVAPATPVIQFVPPAPVAVGQTYAIDWSDTAGEDGSYVVERSTSQQFTQGVDQQQIGSTAASFVSTSEGIHYHRVRAVAACDPAKQSANSFARSVSVVSGPPVVVVTVPPQAAIVDVGGSLEPVGSTMTIENISRSTVVVSVIGEVTGSASFFSVVDPAGGDVSRLALPPRVPKQLAIRFSGVSTAAAATYQGLISIRGVGQPLAVIPYAYLNLKIGASGNATPTFRVAGADSGFASFPGYSPSSPDAARPTLRVEIVNPGDTPLDVGGEIGPDAWLVPKIGWNATSIPPKSSISVELSTDRSRALAGSALPRYTYFTVRTKNGQSARLLVQDNDVLAQGSGALPPISAGTRSFILPRVAAVQGASVGYFRTRLRLSNVSNVAVNCDLYFIPMAGAQNAMHTTVVVPPNDVVATSDVLFQLFGITLITGPAIGNLEIRTATSDAQFLTVTAATYATVTATAELAFHIPVILRGEGAGTGRPHSISGVTQNEFFRSILTLVETTRTNPVLGTFTLFDKKGTQTAQLTFALERAGEMDIAIGGLLGSSTTDAGRIEVSVSGEGRCASVLSLIDNVTGNFSSVYVGRPIDTTRASSKGTAAAAPSITYAVVGTVDGTVQGRNYSTLLGLSASHSAGADLFFSYFSPTYTSNVRAHITLAPGQTLEIPNASSQLFQLPPGTVSQGTISIEASAPVEIYGRIIDDYAGLPHVAGNIPIITTASEALTSAIQGFQRPVYFDGLDQSVDPNRGSRWSLSLSEINGASAVVTIRLYEPGNRTTPIAEQDFSIQGREFKVLNTVFAAMGLDAPERRKDRTNVQVVVVPKSGNGAIAAVANGFDATTGDVVRYLLTPNGGIAATGVSKVTAITLPPPPPRRRAVR